MDIIEEIPSGNRITTVNTKSIVINEIQYDHSLLLTTDSIQQFPEWDGSESISDAMIEAVIHFPVDVVLVGLGQSPRFPALNVYARFAANQIGLEVMNLAAACRTYNLIAAEMRPIAAILILPA